MLRYHRGLRGFVAALAALAGFVDAIGFLGVGGFFVSFMSGNSTRFGVGLAAGSVVALLPLLLIGVFVFGVALGESIGLHWPAQRRVRVLALVALLLGLAAALSTWIAPGWAVLPAAMAMGAVNTILGRDQRLPVGVTYMTGTLVQLGQHLPARWRGAQFGQPLAYLLHWLALVTGGVAGGVCFARAGMQGLWLAAVWAFLLALVPARAIGLAETTPG